MLRPIFWAMKIAIFSIIVLALSNWIHWRGRTISDQVKTNISHAERLSGEAAENAKNWVQEKKRQAESAWDGSAQESAQDSIKEKSQDAPERIAPSERQKLRALIRELNGTRKRD